MDIEICMKVIDSTAEVLAYKVLNRLTDKRWVDWAYDMLVAGFETESLLIIAGLQEPLNYFEMRILSDKVFYELQLDCLDEDKILINYATYLIRESLDDRIKSWNVLQELNNVYITLDYYIPFQEFFDLYYAYDDLQTCEMQWYIDGVDRSNIDQTIIERFQKWIIEKK